MKHQRSELISLSSSLSAYEILGSFFLPGTLKSTQSSYSQEVLKLSSIQESTSARSSSSIPDDKLSYCIFSYLVRAISCFLSLFLPFLLLSPLSLSFSNSSSSLLYLSKSQLQILISVVLLPLLMRFSQYQTLRLQAYRRQRSLLLLVLRLEPVPQPVANISWRRLFYSLSLSIWLSSCAFCYDWALLSLKSFISSIIDCLSSTHWAFSAQNLEFNSVYFSLNYQFYFNILCT